MLVFGNRASGILCNFLQSCAPQGPVLMPANVCPAVPLAVLKAGRRPISIDIDRSDFNIDRDLVSRFLRRHKAAAVIFVHSYGAFDESAEQCFETLKRIQPDVRVVDDRCLLPPSLRGSAGADLTLYSTGYSKIVDLNQGGLGVLSSKCKGQYRVQEAVFSPAHLTEVDHLIREFQRGIPVRIEDAVAKDWLNLRPLTEPRAYLDRVESETSASVAHRRAINRIYESKIAKSCQLGSARQLWRFNLLVPQRQRLLARIFDEGLYASTHYADVSALLGLPECRRAKEVATRIVNLFNGREIAGSDAERISQIVNQHLESI